MEYTHFFGGSTVKKLKPILLSLTVAASVLISSTSAFAYGNAIETDSASAPNVFSGYSDDFEGTINNNVSDENSSYDFDYFKWTNDTGSSKTFFVNFDTYQNRSLDYRIHSIGTTGSGSGHYRVSYGTGKETWQVLLAPGETLTVKVGSASLYKFDPNVKYIISLGSTAW
jgi:hypothetical protein